MKIDPNAPIEPCVCGGEPFFDTTGYATGAAIECGKCGGYRIAAYGGEHEPGRRIAALMWNAAMRALNAEPKP